MEFNCSLDAMDFKRLNPISTALLIIALIGILLMVLAYFGLTPK
jgi:fumarate reductase subunit C